MQYLPVDRHQLLMLNMHIESPVPWEKPKYTGSEVLDSFKAEEMFTLVVTRGLAGFVGHAVVAYTFICVVGPS